MVKDMHEVVLLVRRTGSPDTAWEMALQKGAGADGVAPGLAQVTRLVQL